MDMTKKRINIRFLGWFDFSPDLVEDMWEIIGLAHSISVKSEESIVLEFNDIGPGWEVTREKDLKQWSNMMLIKHPNYLLVPLRLENNKIICYVSKVRKVRMITKEHKK